MIQQLEQYRQIKVVHRHSDQGFTLLETLLVLSIVIVIMTIPILTLAPLYQQQKAEHFLEQLEDDLLYAQVYALSNSATVRVYFSTQQSYRVIVSQTNQIILTRTYDNDIKIDPYTLGSTVTFRSNGNVSNAGTIRITIQKAKYNLVFMIGKGRFYVAKQ